MEVDRVKFKISLKWWNFFMDGKTNACRKKYNTENLETFFLVEIKG